jgi:hypothetical protein
VEVAVKVWVSLEITVINSGTGGSVIVSVSVWVMGSGTDVAVTVTGGSVEIAVKLMVNVALDV